MTDHVFYEDISRYQAVIDRTYPYPILCFRVDSGFSTDANAVKNWAAVRSNPKIRMGLAYIVFIPGHTAQIMARVRATFGTKCPPNLAFMIDMESGSGFAGPGNHSTEANELAELLAIYAGNRARVCGYANTPDWSSCWPQHPTWLKRIVARYSATPPSIPWYGWQYSDGSGHYPIPTGYPLGRTDMNVIPRSLDQILADFGITPPVPTSTPATTPEGITMNDAQVNARFDKLEADIASLSKLLANIFRDDHGVQMRAESIAKEAIEDEAKAHPA